MKKKKKNEKKKNEKFFFSNEMNFSHRHMPLKFNEAS